MSSAIFFRLSIVDDETTVSSVGTLLVLMNPETQAEADMDSNKGFGLTKALTFAALMFGATAANADDTGYSVSVIRDAAYGQLILDEEYDAAIEELEQVETRGLDAFYAATNLCIAYLKTGALPEAQANCDKAVQEIEAVLETRVSNHGLYPETQRNRRAFLAIALTNRGVVQALDGKDVLAEADFVAAIEVRSRLDQPETNFEHFSQMAALRE